MKILITIVDRKKGDEVVRILETGKTTFQMICFGKGTANSEILDYLGIGETDKDIVISFMEDDEVSEIMSKLYEEMEFSKRGHGVAFTIPVDSIGKKTLGLIKGNIMEDAHE